jgi:hypothetical protein
VSDVFYIEIYMLTSSSSIAQRIHLLLPIDMHPKMGTDTRRPLLPKRR